MDAGDLILLLFTKKGKFIMCGDPGNLQSIEHEGETYYIVGEFVHPVVREIFEVYVECKMINIGGYFITHAVIEGKECEVVAVYGSDCYCHLNGFIHGLNEAVLSINRFPELLQQEQDVPTVEELE